MTILKEFAAYEKDEEYISYLEKSQEKLGELIEKLCWNEDRFIRGFTEAGEIIGQRTDPEANMWLNPQSWAVISGLATKEQSELALEQVYERLNTEYGAILMDPPYHAHAFDGALAVIYNAGTKENAGNNAENSGASDDSVYNYNGKKKLTWPVMGNIILPYSMDATVYYTTLDQYACNDGIIVGAKVGEEVVSPANGRVVYIEDTDRYGKVVTILLGNYYKAYCGQLDNVDYEIGDDIQEGDVLGTVAEPTKSFVLEGPNVFFKMTYKDKTVNPVKYLRV